MNSLFYLFSTLALMSGGMVTQAHNPVHSVLYLILVFFNGAALLILLGLDFFAMIFSRCLCRGHSCPFSFCSNDVKLLTWRNLMKKKITLPSNGWSFGFTFSY